MKNAPTDSYYSPLLPTWRLTALFTRAGSPSALLVDGLQVTIMNYELKDRSVAEMVSLLRAPRYIGG
jgi:hypothetical protein